MRSTSARLVAAFIILWLGLPARAASAETPAATLTEANFREYIECFNRRDYACFGKYYADEVTLSKGPQWPLLRGKEAIFDFYRDVDAHGLKEHMTIHRIVVAGDRVSADLEAQFNATRDWPDFGSRVVKAGDAWSLRGVLQYEVVAGKFVAIAPAPRSRDAAADCPRACLERIVNNYLDALAARDPKRLPLAPDVRFTENGAVLPLGDGLWKTTIATTDYRIHVADPQAGQAGFIGTVVQEDGTSAMLALRLKVSGGLISEIETVTGAPFQLPGAALVAAPRPVFARAVPAAQRLTREQMIALANRNFDGILAADGSHFAGDCQRVENRMAMSGNPRLDYPIATLPGRVKPAFAAMGCQDQVEAHLFDTLDSVDPRRYLVIDEERQLVFGVFMLNWYRDTQCNEVKDYGRVCRPEGQTPTGLRTAEILRVTGGRVHEVEVVFSFAPYEAQSGWEPIAGCDRACLTAVMDDYLGALGARDPARLDLADNVKFTENGSVMRVGEGL